MRPRPSGMTLLELLLVLTVLAVLAGLSAPYLQRYLAEQELKQNVSLLRTELAGTRIKAADTGLIYQFRTQPDGQWFVVLPHESLSTAAGETAAHAGSQGGTPLLAGRLSPSCRFLPPQVVSAQSIVTERLPEEWVNLMPESNELKDINWSQPILFYPLGGATDDVVTVADQEGRQVTLFVRGLTGGVTAGSLVYGTP